jgi:hypothetical protein
MTVFFILKNSFFYVKPSLMAILYGVCECLSPSLPDSLVALIASARFRMLAAPYVDVVFTILLDFCDQNSGPVQILSLFIMNL